QAEWDALIAAAKDEGQVVLVFGGAAGRNYRPVAAFFQEKFGIEAVVSTGSGSAQSDRILAEREAGQYLVDVMWVGGGSANARLVPANALDPIADLFIHPEVTDQSLWFRGKHWYADEPQKYVFSLSAETGPIKDMRYNTNLVTQEDLDGINSVFDYLDPKWKGKIVALSPIGGSVTFFTSYVHPEIGKEWIDRFVSPELDVTFLRDFRQIVDGIAKGKFHFGIEIGGAGRDLDALATLGAPVEKFPCTVANVCVKELKEAGVISSTDSSNNMMVPTNRPHPNAAKLFVNWFLTKEGQTIMHTLSGENPEQTLRIDVTDLGKTLPYQRRDPNREYFFFSADPVYVAKRAEALDYAKAAYNATH
ncbi:MAG: ABC transporter substrate-binding protein, partial [Chloroflexi bacterium]|nr:ABC transporter substrate-binding protein [Chloroflexota bacterium]